MSSQREIRRARAIKADFENDPQKRFHMEGFHGKGGQGSIFKFKYVQPGSSAPVARSMVIKIEGSGAGVGPGLETEKAILKVRYIPFYLQERDKRKHDAATDLEKN